MPFVEGESLRVRLAREGELPVGLAVRLLREVARALSYAHRHGIVHRDIKPDNILLAEDEVQVADFGIAKALESSAERSGLTSAGITLGTPAYMAPEQATGDVVDHRADLDALGCVAYEMLTGQPPFDRRTPQAMLAAHVSETPPVISARRPGVPTGLGELVMRLLEKHPADRPQHADEVVRILEGSDTLVPKITPDVTAPTARVTPVAAPVHRARWLVAAAVGILVLVITMAAVLRRRPAGPTPDRGLGAVAPFRVTGADSGLGYLREGMADLLSAKLSGTSETRSADPRTVINTWRSAAKDGFDLTEAEAVALAARLGAGRLVLGELVGDRQRLTINAALFDVPGGGVRVRTSVEGPMDSLPRLVDHLAARLLALGAGEDERGLAALTSTSLMALRAYIDGQALLRRGHFEAAQQKFERALQADSTFALAGLAYSSATEWLGGNSINRGSLLAWRERDRLPPSERRG